MQKIFAIFASLLITICSNFANADVVRCSRCGGRGHLVGAYTAVTCNACNGTGKLYVQSNTTSGRTVYGYTVVGNSRKACCKVTYFNNGVAYVENYPNQPLKINNSPIRGFDYFVILTLPNYQQVGIYFNR